MPDIYQRIWTADQEHNGIEAIISNETGDAERGYAMVHAELGETRDASLRVLPEVHIPPGKRESYRLCEKLFNNYALPESARETDTPKERNERHAFVEAVLDSPPMRLARDYIEQQSDAVISDERWHTTLIDHWFRRFEQGGDPHLSGFEHVVVGEQEGGKVQGYHFWYKYYLDDGFAHQVDAELHDRLPGRKDDRITYVQSKAGDRQRAFPESVTIEFAWDAPDYEKGAYRPLHKKIGGFFVGCSVEGLMALGTVRAHLGAQAPKVAVIEGAKYQLKVYRSANDRHIRTFYPVFMGPADPITDQRDGLIIGQGGGVAPGEVRILAAFVNPGGHDPGREKVTLVNVGPTPRDLKNWRLRDKNGKEELIGELPLLPGTPETVTLSGAGAQLSNKGSTIALIAPDGALIHQVSYSKAQARAENRTLIFS